jgi:hypothetical protein
MARRRLFRTPLAGLSLLALFGCGPRVDQLRLAWASPRAPDCAIEFLELGIADVAPTGTWEILAHVTVSDHGDRDPVGLELRDLVRPRACALGGEAITILAESTGRAGVVDYLVLRPRVARAKATPRRF